MKPAAYMCFMLSISGFYGYHKDGLAVPDTGENMIEYVYYPDKVSWNDAQTLCQRINGTLAKIDSYETKEMLWHVATANYNEDIFGVDFWIGLVEPEAGKRTWVSDCSLLSYNENFLDAWKDTELCFRIKVKERRGENKQCKDVKSGFLCEIATDKPCAITKLLNIDEMTGFYSNCDVQCSKSASCWAAFEITNQCYMLTSIDSTSANFRSEINSKYCYNVTKGGSIVLPDPLNTDNVPNFYFSKCQNSTESPVVPSSVVSILSSTVVPESSFICPVASTVTVVSETSIACPVASTVTGVSKTPIACSVASTVTVLSETPIACPVASTVTVVSETPIACPIASTVTVVSETPIACPVASTVTVVSESSYACPEASTVIMNRNITIEKAEAVAEEIVKNLTVDVKTTSSYTRKLTSANDKRQSAQYMGYIGVLCVAVPIGLLLLADVKKIITDFRSYENIYKKK